MSFLIMSGDNPRKILDGKKTMTRRPVPNLGQAWIDWETWELCPPRWPGDTAYQYKVPYLKVPLTDLQLGLRLSKVRPLTIQEIHYRNKPGDEIWIKESYHPMRGKNGEIIYKADQPLPLYSHNWMPGRLMGRVHSRITVILTGLGLEKLQEISNEDILKEGVDPIPEVWTPGAPDIAEVKTAMEYRKPFKELWNSLYHKPGFTWDDNPWVWVLEFKLKEVK